MLLLLLLLLLERLLPLHAGHVFNHVVEDPLDVEGGGVGGGGEWDGSGRGGGGGGRGGRAVAAGL